MHYFICTKLTQYTVFDLEGLDLEDPDIRSEDSKDCETHKQGPYCPNNDFSYTCYQEICLNMRKIKKIQISDQRVTKTRFLLF